MSTSQIPSASLIRFPKYAELPLELRLHVIETAIRHNFLYRLAPWATVNSEWNRVLERVLFRKIKINNGEASDFARICGKRQSLLDKILLNLRLSQQDYPDRLVLNQGIVMDNVTELFHVLKDWNYAERSHRLITLSIHMDSDVSVRTNEGWAVESLNYDFTSLPEVKVIGKLFTKEQTGDAYYLHHSAVDALHRKLPSLHGASIAFPSRMSLQETIDNASSRIITTHATKPNLALLSIVQNPTTKPKWTPISPDFEVRDRNDEIKIGEVMGPLVSLWGETLVSLKLDCVIDVPKFLFTIRNAMLPNLEDMDVVTILDEDEGWVPARFVGPVTQYRVCGDFLQGLTAALPAMRSLTKLDVRFRDPTATCKIACCVFMDLGTRINTKRLVWQPSCCSWGVYHAVVPCCPLTTEGGTMLARDTILPGQMVTELQDAVWQHRHQKLSVFCCRDDWSYYHPILPCTQWNKETRCWDFVFLNDMDVFIYEMGVFFTSLEWVEG